MKSLLSSSLGGISRRSAAFSPDGKRAARAHGVGLRFVNASTTNEIETAFADLVQQRATVFFAAVPLSPSNPCNAATTWACTASAPNTRPAIAISGPSEKIE
jgi:hypothetical protein